MFEFVEKIEYPVNLVSIKLFRNIESGEGAVLAKELSQALKLKYLSSTFKKNPDVFEKIHFYLLKGEDLKNFKNYLTRQNILEYKRVGRVLLITETGIAFLLGKNRCKEEILRDRKSVV